MRIIYYLKVIKSVKAYKKLTEVLFIEVLLEMGRKSGRFKHIINTFFIRGELQKQLNILFEVEEIVS